MFYISLTIGPGPSLTTVVAVEETKNVFFERREWLMRHLRSQPAYRQQLGLRVVDVVRHPFTGSLARLANPVSAAIVKVQERLEDDARVRLLGECSDYVYGRSVAEFLMQVRVLLLGEVYSSPVEVVSLDLPRPSPEGWRVKVPRRDVVSALSRRSGDDSLRLDVKGPLARELAVQLADLTQKPQRAAEEEAPIEDLALGVALVCYGLENRPRSGYIGDISYPKDSEPDPEDGPRSPSYGHVRKG